MRVISFRIGWEITGTSPPPKQLNPTSQNGGEDWLPQFVYQESDDMEIIVRSTSRSFALGSHP
jgi:hypothetical protein